MKRLTFFIITALLLAPVVTLNAAKLADLRCEYLKDPLGIDVAKPCLSWVIESERRGERQSADQLLVSSSLELLAKNQGDLWNSGKVASDQSIQVEYAGKPLVSRMQCFWKMRIWFMAHDSAVQGSEWSRKAEWSMGLLKPDDWNSRYLATLY